MKGIIFNCFEDFIIETYGEESMDQIFENSSLLTKEPFVGPGTYPSQDLNELIYQASLLLDIKTDKLLRHYGQFLFPKLVEVVPQFVDPYDHPKDFLMSIEGVIHMEVKKMYQNAYTPVFSYSSEHSNHLRIQYYSKRKLYALMAGLIDGVGKHFHYSIDQTQNRYDLEGKEVCDFDLEFKAL